MGRVSTIRLETFNDSVFAIAVTLLALQFHPPIWPRRLLRPIGLSTRCPMDGNDRLFDPGYG
jgi:hypothetical protein